MARPCSMEFHKSNMNGGLFFMDEMEVRHKRCKGVVYGWDMDMIQPLDS
jgi:hypothetical protein